MDIKQIRDSITEDKTIVFHSTHSGKELADMILKREFRAGSGGGAMLGKGFYANQHLYQAQKGNYGNNILKARVFGIKKFLILDREIFNLLYPDVELKSGKLEHVFYQLEKSNMGDIKEIEVYGTSISTAKIATSLWSDYSSRLMQNFYGLEYTGDFDKESIVCWYPEKCVKPLEISSDKGKTWMNVNRVKELINNEDPKASLNKDAEAVRSYQRAKDLLNRYAKYSDDKVANAINSQLNRIADPAKKEQRKDAFIEILNEERPDVVSLLG